MNKIYQDVYNGSVQSETETALPTQHTQQQHLSCLGGDGRELAYSGRVLFFISLFFFLSEMQYG